MKKSLISLLMAGAMVLSLNYSVEAKGNQQKSATTLSVGVNPVPHGELLELIKDDLAAQGIDLKIVVFTDYVQPNSALLQGDLDANYFQTIPYLESSEEWKNALSFIWAVHVEPYGLYSEKYKNINDIPNGATIAINNDPANEGRALLLLQANGLITLAPNSGLRATPQDITVNPKNLKFRELEAAQLPRALPDVDAATINGNYALEAGLNPVKDSLAIEGAESPYANGLVVKKGTENDPRFEALKKVLLSQKVKDYINSHYNGGVVATF
ncbi:lipoprotein, nlpa family [Treponema primitia ZAS-2]|uniref:Lipoprotein n=1 Tax=Treponema primitia (strain ATCC BAA-887 / DSM 12427 / ZAS-2) TaxID=545694 RepID=F5YQK8_TREPZ|nr:MetQ/NlpA family ABC transporter substrate-binding protein [Treponema primitia]AEF86190.1 lipoprotein, nlpa family [Treponema primitia ZAS-2]